MKAKNIENSKQVPFPTTSNSRVMKFRKADGRKVIKDERERMDNELWKGQGKGVV